MGLLFLCHSGEAARHLGLGRPRDGASACRTSARRGGGWPRWPVRRATGHHDAGGGRGSSGRRGGGRCVLVVVGRVRGGAAALSALAAWRLSFGRGGLCAESEEERDVGGEGDAAAERGVAAQGVAQHRVGGRHLAQPALGRGAALRLRLAARRSQEEAEGLAALRRVVLKESPQLVAREPVLRSSAASAAAAAADARVGQVPFEDLALEHLLLERARGEQPPDGHVARLAVAEDASGRLLVRRGVPVRVEEDEPVGRGEVEAGAARLGREEEGRLAGVRRVEPVDELLPLLLWHLAVDADGAEAEPRQPGLDEVERGLELAAHDHAVSGGGDGRHQAEEGGRLANLARRGRGLRGRGWRPVARRAVLVARRGAAAAADAAEAHDGRQVLGPAAAAARLLQFAEEGQRRGVARPLRLAQGAAHDELSARGEELVEHVAPAHLHEGRAPL
mmetsp:Transcript_17166/g.56857  ORF Transcript_17166/g.56857 Transcript_17166/m.56857 type:complete len:449 (+) Transcript_17166:404-1750(+)